jgi:hypothetical protein
LAGLQEFRQVRYLLTVCALILHNSLMPKHQKWWLGAELANFPRVCTSNMPDFIGYSSKFIHIQTYSFLLVWCPFWYPLIDLEARVGIGLIFLQLRSQYA